MAGFGKAETTQQLLSQVPQTEDDVEAIKALYRDVAADPAAFAADEDDVAALIVNIMTVVACVSRDAQNDITI